MATLEQFSERPRTPGVGPLFWGMLGLVAVLLIVLVININSLYSAKQQAHAAEQRVSSLQSQIDVEEKRLAKLKAEYADQYKQIKAQLDAASAYQQFLGKLPEGCKFYDNNKSIICSPVLRNKP